MGPGQNTTDEFWEESDVDKDGFVSWAEFTGSPEDGDTPPYLSRRDEDEL